MKLINKHFKTIKQADRYHLRLMDKYNSVKIINYPRFSETGLYTWQISK
jgi:hypothetical protein